MGFVSIEWVNRTDGVVYFEPIGFSEAYFIYPAYYDEDNSAPRLYILNNQGQIRSVMNVYDFEEAKRIVSEIFKGIITQYL